MKQNSIQSPEGLVYLNALIEAFPDQNAQMRLQDILDQAAHALETDLDEQTRTDLIDILNAYSSETIACPADGNQVLCIFQSLGDGLYTLIADPDTIAALSWEDDKYVSEQALPENTITLETLTTNEEDKAAFQNDRAAADYDVQADLASAGLFDAPITDAAQTPHRQKQIHGDKAIADYSIYAENAQMANDTPSDRTMESIDGMAYDTASLLDEANAAVLQARDRADKAESENARLQKELDRSRAENADLKESSCKAQSKTQKKIRKAQDRIEQQERKIADHCEQIEDNSTGMMKSLHKALIRHDQKVIDRKERKLAGLHDKMACQNPDADNAPEADHPEVRV